MQRCFQSALYVTGCVVVTCLTHTFAYHTGAPKETCVSMAPGHVGEDSGSPPPFRIVVEPAEYRANTIVRVTLTTCAQDVDGFKGFILQARLSTGESTTPIGVFNTPPQSQSVKGCGTALQQAVTHTSNATKTEIQFEWSHPVAKGHVVMVASMVHSYSRFWRNVYSEVIYDTSQPRELAAPYLSVYPTPSTCEPVMPSTQASTTRLLPSELGETANSLGSLENYSSATGASGYRLLSIALPVMTVFV